MVAIQSKEIPPTGNDKTITGDMMSKTMYFTFFFFLLWPTEIQLAAPIGRLHIHNQPEIEHIQGNKFQKVPKDKTCWAPATIYTSEMV